MGGLPNPKSIYDVSFAHDVAITVYDSVVLTYELNVNAGVSLSSFAMAALDSLPITYTPQTKVVFDLFVKTFGNRFPTTATYGGKKEQKAKCTRRGHERNETPHSFDIFE